MMYYTYTVSLFLIMCIGTVAAANDELTEEPRDSHSTKRHDRAKLMWRLCMEWSIVIISDLVATAVNRVLTSVAGEHMKEEWQ